MDLALVRGGEPDLLSLVPELHLYPYLLYGAKSLFVEELLDPFQVGALVEDLSQVGLTVS